MKLVKDIKKGVGKVGKSAFKNVGNVASAVVKAGKKVATNTFTLVGDALLHDRNDIELVFKNKIIHIKFYGNIKKNNKTEATYSDVLAIVTFPNDGLYVCTVTKGLTHQMEVSNKFKIEDITEIEFDKTSNALILKIEHHKMSELTFIFASTLNRAQFSLELLTRAEERLHDVKFEMTMEELVEFVVKELKRQNTDGRLHLVSKEDEVVLRKMLQKYNYDGMTMDLEELQRKLENDIVKNEDQLYQDYLKREKIGSEVVQLYDEVDKALQELESFTNKLYINVETIRPGVEMIQYNNNRLEVVHTNQTKFIGCLDEFINSLLIDPISLYTVRTCQEQLERAENLKKICESATVVALAANYSPPEIMKGMVALKEEQDYNKSVLKDFSEMLSGILQTKLKVEMDFLNINKIMEVGANLILRKEKKQKETLEGAHKTIAPFGDLIGWLKLYANEEFLKVRNSYIEKMTKVANVYFGDLVDRQKKAMRPMSDSHSKALSKTKFIGPKVEDFATIDKKIFLDEEHEKGKKKDIERMPMYDVVRATIDDIAFNAKAEFKFLVEIFQMEMYGENGINSLIDDVYKQTFDALEKLIDIIDSNDPFLLLKIVYLCKQADIEIELTTHDMSKLTKLKQSKKEKEEQEEKIEPDEVTLLKQQRLSLKKAQISRQSGARSLIDLVPKRKVVFDWLAHFYDVIADMCLKRFENFIEKQKTIISATIVMPKKHGVTTHFKQLPYFFIYMRGVIGEIGENYNEQELWKVMDPILQPIISNFMRCLFDWLKNVKDTQIDQKPTMTFRFQNFYYYQEWMSSETIKCLEPFIAEARNEYAIAIRNLCYHHLNLHFGKFFEFFDHIGRLIPSMKRKEEISYQQAYNKQNCAKICKIVSRQQFIKSIEYICRSIKHHIVKQEHREKAWEVVSEFIKARYTEAEGYCELVYHHKFDVKTGTDLEEIFVNAFNKTYKRNEQGDIIEDTSNMSETFEDF